eukprot:364388-Chlamydomonas_euryale.AAC.7
MRGVAFADGRAARCVGRSRGLDGSAPLSYPLPHSTARGPDAAPFAATAALSTSHTPVRRYAILSREAARLEGTIEGGARWRTGSCAAREASGESVTKHLRWLQPQQPSAREPTPPSSCPSSPAPNSAIAAQPHAAPAQSQATRQATTSAQQIQPRSSC